MINIYSVGQKAAITNDAEKTSPAMLHFLEDVKNTQCLFQEQLSSFHVALVHLEKKEITVVSRGQTSIFLQGVYNAL